MSPLTGTQTEGSADSGGFSGRTRKETLQWKNSAVGMGRRPPAQRRQLSTASSAPPLLPKPVRVQRNQRTPLSWLYCTQLAG